MEVLPKKVYYSIGEVADMLQVTPSLIRFWEKSFPELAPQKTNKGNRQFNFQDIELISTIHLLVKKRGYTLEGAKQALQTERQQLRERSKHLHALKDVRQFFHALRENLKKNE